MNIFNKVIRYNKEGKCVTSEYKGDAPLDIKSKKKKGEEGLIALFSQQHLH